MGVLACNPCIERQGQEDEELKGGQVTEWDQVSSNQPKIIVVEVIQFPNVTVLRCIS